MTDLSTTALERALHTCARIVAKPGGERYAPIYERLERELAARRDAKDVQARARALLASPTPEPSSRHTAPATAQRHT